MTEVMPAASEAQQRERLAQLVDDFNSEFDLKKLREIWAIARALEQRASAAQPPREAMEEERLISATETRFARSDDGLRLPQETELPPPVPCDPPAELRTDARAEVAPFRAPSDLQEAPARRRAAQQAANAKREQQQGSVLACFGIKPWREPKK